MVDKMWCRSPTTLIKQLWRFTGVIAIVLAWIVIGISVYRNPWFNMYNHALSDLGGPYADSPWIYNVGLIAVGILVCIYSLYLAYVATNKLYVYSSALMFVAGIFLALIGLFPSGTKPHSFVSLWFFIQTWLSLLVTALSMTKDRRIIYSLMLWIITIIGPLGAVLIKWPSVAILEVFGVILVDVYVVILTINF